MPFFCLLLFSVPLVCQAFNTPWISTTKDESIAINTYDSGYGVVRIDLDQVNSEVVDLSNGIPGYEGTQISNWSVEDREVLIRGYIPPKVITRR
jgi:hypothetical protein